MSKSLYTAILTVLVSCLYAQGKTVSTDTVAFHEDRVVSIDSSKLSAIAEKVKAYLANIETEPAEIQKREADFMIETCSDSLVRQAVALNIYDFYLKSKIMGTEAVAVYICDKWFTSGKIQMHSEIDLMNARIYAEFNRSSLIGMQAPELALLDSLGNSITLFPKKGTETVLSPTGTGRYSILFFYSTDCPRCLAESIMMRNILENSDFNADLYAINTGRSRKEWTDYIRNHLNVNSGHTGIFHLWDPQTSSGFQMKYGIMQTPGLFLINPEGRIIGRRLDAISLEKLLQTALTQISTEYGSDESSEFYDKVFAPYGDSLECKDITSIAEYIEKTSLERGNTMLFKQMEGDLLYYLAGKKEKAYKCGLDYVIRHGILEKDVWTTPEDSMKVRDFALIMQELLDRCRPGTKIHDVKVPATLLKKGRADSISEKNGEFRLTSFRGKRRIIIFYTEGCEACKAEREAARKLLADKSSEKTNILEVNMDMLFSSYPDIAQELFDCFDLISLPFIVETDSKGIVTDRYVSLIQ